ncbi:MAG: GNAT family N-acetyltransferase [Micrococcales bacterium]|nr:GNAT family N-acetyltransferase [Micrococcales bacterium]MCL2667757.1 GNAT family N-acetyltransferase [Micrococcales bacterium]
MDDARPPDDKTVTVAVVRPDDLGELAGLAARTFPMACPPGTTRENIDQFIAGHLSADAFAGYLADNTRRLLLARSGGGAVGYVMMVAGDPSDPAVAAVVTDRPTTELSKCYVDLHVHGSGVAARLVAAAMDLARADGARTCWLGVNQLNVRAQRFYAKQGFAVVGTKTFDVGGEVHDDFVMLRPLGEAS